ncbi:MAG: DegV family protein [Clostridiales bacterium]|nr:DegV family protein [Clostridiales bacterium]
MNPVKIFTDSTADLTADLREKFGIPLIPLYVTIGGKTYKDQIDIDTATLYDLVERHQELPKTSTPSTQDFINGFQPWIDKGYDIIFFGISSKLSATVQAAKLAAQEFDNGRVNIVDSTNLSMGIGLIALRSAQWASKGIEAKEILERITGMLSKIRTSFVIDSLKFLHMGGRCSSVELIAGTVLKIRPQIIVNDGGLIVSEKYRGKKEKVLKDFYDNHVGKAKNIDKEWIAVAHSADPKSAKYLEERLRSQFEFKNFLNVEAGTVISSHCGPGTVGIIYFLDN